MSTPCKHRWEPSEFGRMYWAPNTYQYRCARCGAMEMVTLIPKGEARHAGELATNVPGSASDATA